MGMMLNNHQVIVYQHCRKSFLGRDPQKPNISRRSAQGVETDSDKDRKFGPHHSDGRRRPFHCGHRHAFHSSLQLHRDGSMRSICDPTRGDDRGAYLADVLRSAKLDTGSSCRVFRSISARQVEWMITTADVCINAPHVCTRVTFGLAVAEQAPPNRR